MKDCSCIICLLFVSSSSPNTLYYRKHVCMLNIWLWLYWTDINLHRRKLRENNKVMALNHKYIVVVKENLCFQHSTNWLGGSSWTWGELQCMSGLTLSAYLIDIERFKLVRTDVLSWYHMKPIKSAHDPGQLWNTLGYRAVPLWPRTFRKALFTSLFWRL